MKHHEENHQDEGCECKEKGKECNCHSGERGHHHEKHHGGQGCCNPDRPMGTHFQRRHKTKAERITELETYLGELKLEIQAVEEILAELRK